MTDLEYLDEACHLAQAAAAADEWPVGALIVRSGIVLARGRNETRARLDPTAHAEVVAIRAACRVLARGKLSECVLYTSLFPCPMCEAVVTEVGIRRVVFGARAFPWVREVKYGRHEVEYIGPVMNARCRGIFVEMLRREGRSDILDYGAT